MSRDINKLIAEMTLEEKASLCSGLGFWSTKPIERLGIPTILMTDGPHGLRKPLPVGPEHGIGNSAPATCFPTGPALAASWDTELIEQVGAAIGKESQTEGVQIVLGPALNIKRSPLCGRNFEYFSEDPYLTGEMAAGHIRGVQSQGVGTSAKHYAVNNQEHRRMSMNAVVDERTLREIYLPGFEGAVKQSQPWTVMAAYNQVNGTFATEHPYLLTDILRNEWGFEGYVVSDWMAVNERVAALAAGLELEMPGNGGYGDRKIIEAVQNGELSIEQLDLAVERFLTIVFRAAEARKENASYDVEQHHLLARRSAAESMVLLKNEEGILPPKKQGRIAVIGEMAKRPRYQGGGSSHIVPTKVDLPWDELVAMSAEHIEWTYAQGYELNSDVWHEELVKEAITAAGQADYAIVFAGLPDRYESEGYDREHMRMPENHNRMIEAIAEVQPNLIVVLSNGSPVEMPWIGQAKAVLEAYLSGQAAGGAVADLLLGAVNPSGKLAETFPMDMKHNPSYFNFPGEGDEVVYREGLLVGYRHYDTKNIKPLFAFGHGLSYTTFEYTGLTLEKDNISDKESVKAIVTVRNTGQMAGKEIIQLYVRDIKSSVMRPDKELKGFRKIHLEPGEEKMVEFILDKRSFAYYNTGLKDWHVETGEYGILVAASSDRIMLAKTLQVNSTVAVPKKFSRNSTIGDLMEDPIGSGIVNRIMQGMGQRTDSASEVSQTPENEANRKMMLEVMKGMPLRNLVVTSKGALSDENLEQLLEQAEQS
ncbi:glycoside hydrolase family 3 C-terminal domain-containing protein [Paenibacillus sinopodophylli]|uniref:glycoside hydrolase family 3 C-terminal domain-containing protein n=1 Tax=Paenibacillus sinopodophylli TaxID=1837342 RepID=UPI00110CF6DC|nr:glycoside hydrolase family 3 C-terminal domain-containing protein [Paenibacillus sinopodophylli]